MKLLCMAVSFYSSMIRKEVERGRGSAGSAKTNWDSTRLPLSLCYL